MVNTMVNTAEFYKLIAVIFIIPLFLLFFSSSSAFAVLGQEERLTQDIDKQPKPQQETPLLKKPQLEYTAYSQRDPFEDYLAQEDEKKDQAEVGTVVEPPPLKVQGVVWGGEVPQAIVNNKVVKKGDVLQEAEIIDISKDGVNVLYKNRVFLLSSPASSYRSVGDKEVTNEK